MEIECASCGKLGELKTVTCEIPFFKEIVLMAFNCDSCGFRNNEVKTIGEVSNKAKWITLYVKTRDELNWDLFKSDSALVSIKELEFEMMPGTLGSFYTTVEGLITLI